MKKNYKSLSRELVRKISEHLKYDPDTGHFFWINPTSCKAKKEWFPGSELGGKGYLGFRVFWDRYYSHRLAWALTFGDCPEDMEIDHINGIRSDNRICNLRLATPSQNQHNKNSDHRNKSGVKGVYFCKKRNKWKAKLSVNCKEFFVGSFDNISDAESAIIAARALMHGKFANHGEVVE